MTSANGALRVTPKLEAVAPILGIVVAAVVNQRVPCDVG
jgi:hypothetical protein